MGPEAIRQIFLRLSYGRFIFQKFHHRMRAVSSRCIIRWSWSRLYCCKTFMRTHCAKEKLCGSLISQGMWFDWVSLPFWWQTFWFSIVKWHFAKSSFSSCRWNFLVSASVMDITRHIPEHFWSLFCKTIKIPMRAHLARRVLFLDSNWQNIGRCKSQIDQHIIEQ